MTPQNWTPESWRTKKAWQQPTYPDMGKLREVEERLAKQPPLVFAGEARKLKKALAKVVIDYFDPFRKKQKELLSRDVYVKEILNRGREKAQRIAQVTIQEVKEKMGLI